MANAMSEKIPLPSLAPSQFIVFRSWFDTCESILVKSFDFYPLQARATHIKTHSGQQDEHVVPEARSSSPPRPGSFMESNVPGGS